MYDKRMITMESWRVYYADKCRESGYDGAFRKDLRPRLNHRALLAISEALLHYTPEPTAVRTMCVLTVGSCLVCQGGIIQRLTDFCAGCFAQAPGLPTLTCNVCCSKSNATKAKTVVPASVPGASAAAFCRAVCAGTKCDGPRDEDPEAALPGT